MTTINADRVVLVSTPAEALARAASPPGSKVPRVR